VQTSWWVRAWAQWGIWHRASRSVGWTGIWARTPKQCILGWT
jgi:hypothetical protein